jgi:hypothetical protein
VQDSRKKLEFALLILLPMGTTQGCGERSAPVPMLPAIEVRPKRIDLGDATAAADAAMPVVVRIMNRGLGALQIFSVQSSCGCTVVQRPLDRVEAGREESLRVTVRTGAQPGPKSANLTIETSDPVSPNDSDPHRLEGCFAADL